jgi:hypothetical protein
MKFPKNAEVNCVDFHPRKLNAKFICMFRFNQDIRKTGTSSDVPVITEFKPIRLTNLEQPLHGLRFVCQLPQVFFVVEVFIAPSNLKSIA